MDRFVAWSPERPAISAPDWCRGCSTKATECARWPAIRTSWPTCHGEQQAEVARGDLNDVDSLIAAFDGIDVVYYLVHSMGSSKNFTAEENPLGHATS